MWKYEGRRNHGRLVLQAAKTAAKAHVPQTKPRPSMDRAGATLTVWENILMGRAGAFYGSSRLMTRTIFFPMIGLKGTFCAVQQCAPDRGRGVAALDVECVDHAALVVRRPLPPAVIRDPFGPASALMLVEVVAHRRGGAAAKLARPPSRASATVAPPDSDIRRTAKPPAAAAATYRRPSALSPRWTQRVQSPPIPQHQSAALPCRCLDVPQLGRCLWR